MICALLTKQKRPAVALISFDVGPFALHRAPDCSLCLSAGCLSSACLDATTISHASGAWSRIFHLMQVCCLPWCPGRPVLCVLRAWLLGVCVSLALLCALPPGLPVSLWPGAVRLCSALLPGVWACYACPVGWACAWALSMGLL